jgi:hypothetical protein
MIASILWSNGGSMTEEEKRKVFSVRFPPDLHKLLTHIAVERGKSLGDTIIEAMAKWASEQPESTIYGKPAPPKPSKPGPKKKKPT